MAGLMDGAFGDPVLMGLMGLAQGFGQAAQPSRMPVPLGAAFGQAAGGAMGGMMQAQKAKLMADQAKRLEQQTEIQRQEFELKRQAEANAQAILPQAMEAMRGFGQFPGGAEAAPQPGQMPGNSGAMPSGAPPMQGMSPIGEAPATAATAPARQQEMARRAYDRLIAKGWKPEQAAGIVGNLRGESPFNPQQVHDDGIGYGILGWNGPRRSGFQQVMGKPIERSTFDEQVDYLDWELRHGPEQGAGKALAMAGDPASAAAIYTRLGVRPADIPGQSAVRGKYATDYFNQFGAGKGMSLPVASAQGAEPGTTGQNRTEPTQQAQPTPEFQQLRPAQQRGIQVQARTAWEKASHAEMLGAALQRSPTTKPYGDAMIRQAAELRKMGMWVEGQLPDGRMAYFHALGAEPPKVIDQARTVEQRMPDGTTRRAFDAPGVTSARELPSGYNPAAGGAMQVIPGGPADQLVETTTTDAQGREVKKMVPRSQLMQPPGQQPNMAPGAGGVTSVKEPPAITQATRTDLEADTKNINGALARLDKARKDFDPSFMTMAGRGANAARSWVEWTTGALPEGDKKKLAAYTEFTTNTLTTLNEHIKAITGAAMGVQEAERLMKAMPTPNDSPTQFMAKLKTVEDGLKAAQERARQMAQTGMRGAPADPGAASPAPGGGKVFTYNPATGRVE